MPKLILTSSFNTVAKELVEKGILPQESQKVAFIPTAAHIYQDKPWMEADRKALLDLGYSVQDVELIGASAKSLQVKLQDCDIIFIAGGNTTFLCEQAHQSGFVDVIKNALQQNKIYIGSSAGSILAGPSVQPFLEEDMEELPKDFVLHDASCLNLVDYIVLPHYPHFAKENEAVLAQYKDKYKFLKMTDHEYKVEDWQV